MNTIQDFITNLVKVEYIEDNSAYGHYPFQLFVETNDGKFDMNALYLGGDIAAVYRRVKLYVNCGAKKIFLSVDFPAGADIKSDFIAVFSIINGELDSLAIPYNPLTGIVYNQLQNTAMMIMINSQFKTLTLNNG